MLAVKGYLDSGRFTPTDGTKLPVYANAVLIVDINISHTAPGLTSKENTGRSEWLNLLRQARQLAKNDPMPDFIVRQPMREPHSLTD